MIASPLIYRIFLTLRSYCAFDFPNHILVSLLLFCREFISVDIYFLYLTNACNVTSQ